MSNLDTKTSLYGLVVGHLSHVAEATRVVKGVLLIGGSLVAGVAQFADIPATGMKSSQIAGIVGCIAVFLAAVWSTLKDRDATEELRLAIQTQHEAEEAAKEIDGIAEVYGDVDRASNLIVANNLMRGLLEHACLGADLSYEDFVDRLLVAVKRELPLSMDLTGNNEWTICVYQTVTEAGEKDKLKLISHARAIECGKDAARVWEEGVGVAGICYSTQQEIIVPDLQSEGVGTLFNVGERQRDYDASRYQSIIAVPILVDSLPRPWGVVTATSDRRNHFVPDVEGIQPAEGARILAGTVALAVAIKSKLAKAPREA